MASLHTLDFDKPIPHGILNEIQNNDAFSTCFAAVLDDQGLIEQINQMFNLKIKINEPKTQIEKLLSVDLEDRRIIKKKKANKKAELLEKVNQWLKELN